MTGFPMRTIMIAMLIALAGCETAVIPRSFPEQTFRHLPPISLDVAKIEFVLFFEPPLKAPHVEHEMPVPPHKAIERLNGKEIAGRTLRVNDAQKHPSSQ